MYKYFVRVVCKILFYDYILHKIYNPNLKNTNKNFVKIWSVGSCYEYFIVRILMVQSEFNFDSCFIIYRFFNFACEVTSSSLSFCMHAGDWQRSRELVKKKIHKPRPTLPIQPETYINRSLCLSYPILLLLISLHLKPLSNFRWTVKKKKRSLYMKPPRTPMWTL
jgi:hypothetical protein